MSTLADSTPFDNTPTKPKRGKHTQRRSQVPQTSAIGLARVVEITGWLGKEWLALQSEAHNEVRS